jgi:hypothetical protein
MAGKRTLKLPKSRTSSDHGGQTVSEGQIRMYVGVDWGGTKIAARRLAASPGLVHLLALTCLGGIAVLTAAGAQVNDFLADGGLLTGNPVVAGPPAVYPALVEVPG